MFYNMFSPTRSITVLMMLTTIQCAAAEARVSCSEMFRETNMCCIHTLYLHVQYIQYNCNNTIQYIQYNNNNFKCTMLKKYGTRNIGDSRAKIT